MMDETIPGERAQRRGNKIAMDRAELDAFLTGERVCRMASISAAGPHNSPLWFVWDGSAIWIYSIVQSQRWTDLQRDPRVAIVVDAGHDFVELRGVELHGSADVVGPIPRTGEEEAPDLDEPERLFADKYTGSERFEHDGRHAWLRIRPTKVNSWDFRKQFERYS
jgi:Pyridoxamine 5'-phosphate oxidase